MRHKTFLCPERGAFVLALLLLVLVAVVGLVTRPLTAIDETRYVSVAWEMWQRGDFLVPFKNGEPYSDKPPFMFWMFHVGWALFGVNEWWPRVLLSLFSAGSLAMTYLLARRLWPQYAELGGQSTLVLMGSLLWIVFSTFVMFDVILAFWVLLGMLGILAASEGQSRGLGLLGVAIGMGILTKGPVMLLHVLPVAALAPWWNSGLKWGRWYGGVLLSMLMGAAIALAWAIPAGFSGGEAYKDAIFLGQTANRLVKSFAHQRPIWWYLPLLPAMLFPWFAWGDLWKAAAQRRQLGLDRGMRFCLAWMGPVFVAFCLISGKQPHYLLPLFPAFALLTVRLLRDRPANRITFPAVFAAVLGLALMLIATGRFGDLRDRLTELPPWWPGALVLLGAFAAWWAVRRAAPAVPALALLSAFVLSLMQLALQPLIRTLYDVKPVALAIRAVQEEGHLVANAAKYDAQYQFLGRLKEPLVELRGDALVEWLTQHPDAYAVVYMRRLSEEARSRARHAQNSRGGAVLLVDAATALQLLSSNER